MSMTDMRAPAGLFLILYQFDGLRYYICEFPLYSRQFSVNAQHFTNQCLDVSTDCSLILQVLAKE